jgi:IS5 family transposase
MRTFFDEADRLARLSDLGDRLVTLKSCVDFEMFRPLLTEIWSSEDNRAGGRQKTDRVLMFKILILQELYNIADDKTEYLINDRLSFQRFLDLQLGDKVPDSKTIWLYKEELTKSGRYKEVFNLYKKVLKEANVITSAGSIVDATIVQRPQQRYNKKKKEREKKGEPEPEETNVRKLRQTDKDATYTSKHGKVYFGYKNHIKVDADTKLIVSAEVTTASTSDGTQAKELVDKDDKVLFGDSAFRGKNYEEAMREKIKTEIESETKTKLTVEEEQKLIKFEINEKNERNNPMSQEQKDNNTRKNKTRCRVEHVFGHMTQSMGGKKVRRIGFKRNACGVFLKNLAYNMSRHAYLLTQEVKSILLPKTSKTITT